MAEGERVMMEGERRMGSDVIARRPSASSVRAGFLFIAVDENRTYIVVRENGDHRWVPTDQPVPKKWKNWHWMLVAAAFQLVAAVSHAHDHHWASVIGDGFSFFSNIALAVVIRRVDLKKEES